MKVKIIAIFLSLIYIATSYTYGGQELTVIVAVLCAIALLPMFLPWLYEGAPAPWTKLYKKKIDFYGFSLDWYSYLSLFLFSLPLFYFIYQLIKSFFKF